MKATELFVSYRYGEDIDEIFTTIEEAEEATIKNNMQLIETYQGPWKVKILNDALEDMKEYERVNFYVNYQKD